MKPLHGSLPSRLAAAALLALCAALPSRADYPSTVLSQGPVGYWRLNETLQPSNFTTTTNLGSLGASANGTYNNVPATGLSGPFTGSSAAGFDGTSQSVTTPYQAGLNPNAFSFEIWVNPTTVPNFAYVAATAHLATTRTGWYMAQDNGSTFGVGNAFVVRMFYANGTAAAITLSATNDLPVGSWYHLVLTYDGTTAALYKNGVVASSGTPLGYVANVDTQLAMGCRSDNNFFWPGKAAEAAMYNGALSSTRVAAHYAAATSSATYTTAVNLDSPVMYYRFQESVSPPAANAGSLGSAVNGRYIYDAVAGVAGPVPSTFPGFEVTNKAVSYDAGGGAVSIPGLNLNTNAITISAWVNPVGSQAIGAGLVVCNSGGTVAGLTMDQVFGGYGLGYVWNGNTYGWSPSTDSSLPTLPDSTWSYVALVVQPSQATLYICDANNFANFTSVNDAGYTPAHINQSFSGGTLIGAEAGYTTTTPNRNFSGLIDEVAIFNRALGAGELYTQYATAVGGVPPKIFNDLVGPVGSVAVGDPIVLTVDGGGTAPNTFIWHTNGAFFTTTTSGVLTIASAALSNAANYDVIISNSFAPPVQSQTVAVSVVTPVAPVITGSQGFLNRTLYPGATINLSITATGGGLKYQWFKGGTNIPSATTAALMIPNIVGTNAGSYSVSVSNSVNKASNGPVVISVITPAAGSYEALMVSAAPEAWWRLNEAPGSTNMFDSMGRHDGVYSNMNGSVPPVVLGSGGALATNLDTCATFSPSYKGVGVAPFSADLNTSPWSIEAWVKTTVLNANLVPVSSSFGAAGAGGGEWMQSISGWWYGNCSAGYFGNSGNANTAAQVVAGQWTHIVLTYDGTRVSGTTHYPNILYVDGQTDGFIWGGPSSLNTGAPFIIGGRGVSPSALADLFMDGQVDEVAVYKRLLSGTEALAHFSFPKRPPFFIGSFLSQTVTAGKTVSFSTTEGGTAPLTNQWYFNGSLIVNATNTSLSLTNVQVTNSGTYTLWVTNSGGSISQSATLTVIPAVTYANVTNGLVLHLRFDGDVLDSSGRGNNGTAESGPAFVPGIVGSGALQYATTTTDGQSGSAVSSATYVNLGQPSDLTFGSSTSFSVSLWVNSPALSQSGDLPYIGTEVGSANNPGWLLCPSYKAGGWQWNLNDGVNNFDMTGPNDSVDDGAWHNFVLTVDRTAKLASAYLDGQLMTRTDTTGLGSINTATNVVIGQDPTGLYPEPGTNTLDDVGIWTRALTPLEVAKVESAGRSGHNSFDSVAPPVAITVTRSGSSVTLHWSTGTLQSSSTLGASAVWTPVSGASAPAYTFTPGSGPKFYRVFVQ